MKPLKCISEQLWHFENSMFAHLVSVSIYPEFSLIKQRMKRTDKNIIIELLAIANVVVIFQEFFSLPSTKS